MALLAAAVVTASSRARGLALNPDANDRVFLVRRVDQDEGSQVVGELEYFDEALVSGLELLSGLSADPRSLALLLEAVLAAQSEPEPRQRKSEPDASDEVLDRLAKRYNRSASQILLKWNLIKGLFAVNGLSLIRSEFVFFRRYRRDHL